MLGLETYRNTDSYKPKNLPMNQILLSMCIAPLLIAPLLILANWNASFASFRQESM